MKRQKSKTKRIVVIRSVARSGVMRIFAIRFAACLRRFKADIRNPLRYLLDSVKFTARFEMDGMR